MPGTASAPLVSVVVRTMGRPALARALDAVAAQSHRPLEVVLVDAAPSGISMVGHSGVPVRIAAADRLDRPRAANAGLDAARGELILFLDEDDAIEPSHIGDLLDALGRTPGARVAYSQTRLVDGDGGRVFGGPFDRLALFRSNYLAIHAALFARSLAAEGCRFDESLATFEDWDFWLQCAQRTAFAFTGKPTALYRAASGESGAGSGSNLDAAAVLAQRERLLAKWRGVQDSLVRRRRYALERAERAEHSGRHDEAAQWSARARAIVAGLPEEEAPPR